jgi:hypothetical protein
MAKGESGPTGNPLVNGPQNVLWLPIIVLCDPAKTRRHRGIEFRAAPFSPVQPRRFRPVSAHGAGRSQCKRFLPRWLTALSHCPASTGQIQATNFRIAKNNRPIGLNQSFQRKRSEIKRIGRLSASPARSTCCSDVSSVSAWRPERSRWRTALPCIGRHRR